MDERLDVVSYWTGIKLRIVKEYAKAYAKIMSKQGPIRHYAYIDAIAGAGSLISRKFREEIDGSPLMALKIEPRFSHYHLIEMNPQRAERLRQLTEGRNDVTIYEGNCNSRNTKTWEYGTLFLDRMDGINLEPRHTLLQD